VLCLVTALLAPALASASSDELIPLLEESLRLRLSLMYAPEAPITRIQGSGLMKRGSSGRRVEQLNRRLAELGWATAENGNEFTESTEEAVRAYQEKAGIEVDGLVDEATRFNLNLSNSDKLRLLDAQFQEMERFFKDNATRRYVVVNLPAFTLKAFENEQPVLSSRVVVGQPARATPLMKTNMTGIVLHPGWSPPPTILDQDIFRNGEVNARAIKRMGLQLLDDKGKAIPLETITSKDDFAAGAYRFHQPSGDGNALGELKFVLDNRFDIYLHDTNHRDLFVKGMRARSSGCIRVESFRELAAWVLSQPLEEVNRQLKDQRTRRLPIETLPVHTVYWQVEAAGKRIIYHPDIYNLKNKKTAI
jgi:murein L,D-transpeptidase YcbB/YkuD